MNNITRYLEIFLLVERVPYLQAICVFWFRVFSTKVIHFFDTNHCCFGKEHISQQFKELPSGKLDKRHLISTKFLEWKSICTKSLL